MFCFSCGEDIDRDPYVVDVEHAFDPFSPRTERAFPYSAFYHTSCFVLIFPGFPVPREAKAAKVRVVPVDDYDVHVTSTTSPWGEVNSIRPVAIGENAEADAREADAVQDADANEEENADGDAENADAEENASVLDEAMDDEEI
jgi:hypothetical protein